MAGSEFLVATGSPTEGRHSPDGDGMGMPTELELWVLGLNRTGLKSFPTLSLLRIMGFDSRSGVL